jgi:hypothetical protein
MPILDFFKKLYYKGEDKWYNFLDQIDKKLPVYKIIDPIDKIVPSFVLFLFLILFLIILLGYLIRLSSPYEVTFTVFDATNDNTLQGVALAGAINEKAFETQSTDSTGKAKINVDGPKYNFYDLIVNALFQTKETFVAQISAKKTGYEEIKNKVIPFENKEVTLKLNKLPTEGPTYSNQLIIELFDDSSREKIIDDSGAAYIKYDCKNKKLSGAPFTITDGQDGSINGNFTIKQDNCNFVITEASSPGYIALGAPTEVDPQKDKERIYLRKLGSDIGTGNVFVYDMNGTNKRPLRGINVTFNKGSRTENAITTTNGIASKNLEIGEYIVTIRDENYAPITLDSNKIIKIKKGETSEIEIELRPATNLGMVYLKVVDENNTPINQASVVLVTLQKDSNGNLIGANPLTNRMEFISGITDSNGLIKQVGFELTEKIVAIVGKQDLTKTYLTEYLLAKVVKYTGTYEVVVLKEANQMNSSSSTVNVRDINNNKPIYRSTTYLYYYTILDGTSILHLPINPSGKLTDVEGKANYSLLTPGIYSAAADLDGDYFSRISEKQSIDANEKKDFNIYLNLNGSTLNFKLTNFKTGAELNGTVDIYYINSDGTKNLIETISAKTNNYYKSSLSYRKTDKLLIVGKSTNYASAQLYLGGNHPMRFGENYYNLKLISNADLDNNNTPDGSGNGGKNRINIFFEDIYSISDNYWEEESTVDTLKEGEKYTGVFKIVVNGKVEYNEILSLARIIGAGQITNARIGLFGEPRVLQSITNCDTTMFDSQASPHDDNYYFPSSSSCTKTSEKSIQGSFKWASAPLEKTIYTMVIDFNIDSNSNGKSLEIHYRGKEKDNNDSTETLLYKEFFTIGEPFRSGLFFKIQLNNQELIVNTTTPRTLLLSQTIANQLKLTLINRTDTDLTNHNLIAYSYTGIINNFNTNTQNGRIFFNEERNQKNKTISNSFNLTKNNNTNFDLNVWSSGESYLVLVISSPTGITNKFFIKTTNIGRSMLLDKANFLAGVLNQEYYAEVKPTSGNDQLKILYAKIEVKKDCRTSNTPATINPNPIIIRQSNGIINGNNFKITIPGIYQYNRDCIDLQIDAEGLDGEIYQTLTKKIFAGSGGTLDTELNCISIDLNGSTPNDEFEPSMRLNWEEKTNLVVTNKNCAKDVIVGVDSGLICKVKNDNNNCSGTKLGIGEKVTFEITGKNIDYNPSMPKPNFSDVLGYYPIYVKAMFVGVSKNFSIAKIAHVSVYNSNQCFAISKDYFNFMQENTNDIGFDLINYCQYIEIGDYFIPKVNLTAFGYDLNIGKTIYGQITYRPEITVIGQTYTQTTVTRDYNYWSSYKDLNKKIYEDVNIEENPDKYNEDELNYYKNLRFDFSNEIGSAQSLKINFTDFNYYFNNNSTTKLGFSIDGNLKITYTDNNVFILQPCPNFDTNTNPISCKKCVPSNTCTIINSRIDPEIQLENSELDYISGTILINLPTNNKQIKWIDMNVIGNLWNEDLIIRTKILLKGTQLVHSYLLNNTSSAENFYLTNNSLQIPALEGVEFVVKNLRDSNIFKNDAFISRSNPKIYLSSGNPSVQVWIEGDLLKAKFIGNDENKFNSGVINGRIISNEGQGINYGIIDITDYVNSTSGKIISGVN